MQRTRAMMLCVHSVWTVRYRATVWCGVLVECVRAVRASNDAMRAVRRYSGLAVVTL
jgi:hypothetical protein